MAQQGRPSQAQRDFAEGLFREHGSRLRAIARRNSINADDAEEAIQRAMLIALQADPEMPGTPLAWATTVVKREAWQVRRKRTHRIQHPRADRPDEHDQHLTNLESTSPGLQETAERSEFVRAFRRVFDSLKPQERQVLLLLGTGLSYKEIEDRTGFTYTKINRCVAEGRSTLRDHMARWEREGQVALEDLYNLKTLANEPTSALLRRRQALVAARQAEARTAEAISSEQESLRRLRDRLLEARTRRLALETRPESGRDEIAKARSLEQDARQELKRLGGRRGARGLEETNAAKRDETIAALDEELARRREPIVRDAVRNQPRYVVQILGPRPQGQGERATWCARVDRLVAFRQRYGITDPERALGKAPSSEARQALAGLRRSWVALERATRTTSHRPGPELAL